MRWTGPVARVGVTKSAYTILVQKSEVKEPLGKSGCTPYGTRKFNRILRMYSVRMLTGSCDS